MAQHIPDVNAASVVLLGTFNPSIFQPQWFVRQNLLPQEEGDKADVKVIAPQICQFETERFKIQVTTNQFSATSKPDANPAPLRELALGTFYVLEHTPLSALGLNREMHFSMPSEGAWHEVGDKLAPKNGWAGILRGRPGMALLSIQAEIPDFPNPTEGTRLTVRVAPSGATKFGVYFHTNENYNAPKDGELNYLMERIRVRWEGAYNYAAEIADYILDWTTK